MGNFFGCQNDKNSNILSTENQNPEKNYQIDDHLYFDDITRIEKICKILKKNQGPMCRLYNFINYTNEKNSEFEVKELIRICKERNIAYEELLIHDIDMVKDQLILGNYEKVFNNYRGPNLKPNKNENIEQNISDIFDPKYAYLITLNGISSTDFVNNFIYLFENQSYLDHSFILINIERKWYILNSVPFQKKLSCMEINIDDLTKFIENCHNNFDETMWEKIFRYDIKLMDEYLKGSVKYGHEYQDTVCHHCLIYKFEWNDDNIITKYKNTVIEAQKCLDKDILENTINEARLYLLINDGKVESAKKYLEEIISLHN